MFLSVQGTHVLSVPVQGFSRVHSPNTYIKLIGGLKLSIWVNKHGHLSFLWSCQNTVIPPPVKHTSKRHWYNKLSSLWAAIRSFMDAEAVNSPPFVCIDSIFYTLISNLTAATRRRFLSKQHFLCANTKLMFTRFVGWNLFHTITEVEWHFWVIWGPKYKLIL